MALALLPVFADPTYHRLLTLAAAAILTTGRRTVANVLRTVGDPAPGHDAGYRRVRSAAQWSGPELGCALTRFLLAHVVPGGAVDLVGDGTAGGHPGAKCTARAGTGMRSGRATPTRRGGTGAGGSSSPCG